MNKLQKNRKYPRVEIHPKLLKGIVKQYCVGSTRTRITISGSFTFSSLNKLKSQAYTLMLKTRNDCCEVIP